MSREPNRNVYVGHRYVPLILEEWDNKISYEGLSVVTHKGASYTSKKRVPVGIDILNKEFWSLTGNYNAQVDYYRQETERVAEDLLLKSDQTYVDTELGKKADKSYTDTELDKKSDKTYVDNELGKKADKSYTDTELDKKSDQSYVDDTIDEFSLNVKHRGAIGDGVTDDWKVIQDTITEAEETGKSVYIPSGEYFVSKPLRTKHMATPLYTQGIKIYGDGKTTILIGNGRGVAEYSDLTTISDGSVIAVHGGNNIFKDMVIKESKVGIFFGQHPGFEDRSNAGHNVFENVWIEFVGTCVLLVHSLGNHYNKFNNFHLMNFQIGFHFSKGLYLEGTNNNNRNMVTNLRVSRGWVGILIDNGDGNSFTNIYGEGMVNNGQPLGSQPANVPVVLTGKPVFILNLLGDENKFNNVFSENCDFDIYSTGYRTIFRGLTVDDDKVLFPGRLPAVFDNKSTITYGAQSLSDYGLSFKEIDIVSNSPDIKSVALNSRQVYKRLGGIGLWQFNIRFEKNDDVDSQDRIRIKIPESGIRNLSALYTREVSSGVTFTFPGYVGISGALEVGSCRVSTEGERDALGYYHILIDPPETGWLDGVINNAVFNINIYDNSNLYI